MLEFAAYLLITVASATVAILGFIAPHKLKLLSTATNIGMAMGFLALFASFTFVWTNAFPEKPSFLPLCNPVSAELVVPVTVNCEVNSAKVDNITWLTDGVPTAEGNKASIELESPGKHVISVIVTNRGFFTDYSSREEFSFKTLAAPLRHQQIFPFSASGNQSQDQVFTFEPSQPNLIFEAASIAYESRNNAFAVLKVTPKSITVTVTLKPKTVFDVFKLKVLQAWASGTVIAQERGE